MPLSVGDKLGHYEVLSLLGKGGMGEVWRARDTTLKRDVALKVLPAVFLRDPDRMARFQREAEVLASLDHPNIGPIYGLVDSADSRALVLALVEGPTLADRIKAGPLPQDDAIVISGQIIEALEYAHERGVVHRDLKPANIKITPEGDVKVLDFGLAKVLEDDPASSSLANSPTLTLGHTGAGVILGTAAYMSPEQAVGRPVDRRTDIFSFGAVLYEMLTSKRAFTGATAPDVLEAVVKNDPDWSALPAHTPAYLRRLLERMLVKDRKQRLQAIGEARIAIKSAGGAGLPASEPPRRSSKFAGALMPGVAAVLAAVLAALAFVHFREAPEARPLTRFSVDLGPEAVTGPRITAAISPDGRRLAFVARGAGGKEQLATRLLDQANLTFLAGSEFASDPFFSPDGQWIGFFTEGKMKKISIQGGAAITLCDAPNARGASWGSDGNIIVTLNSTVGMGLSRVSDSGGMPETLTKPGDSGDASHRWPQILPDGESVLFSSSKVAGDYENATIAVISLKTRKVKVLHEGGYFGRYLPTSNQTGELVYIHQGTLMGLPFNLSKLESQGVPVPLLEDVAGDAATAGGQFDFSRDGTFVYLSGKSSTGTWPLVWLDSSGKQEPLLAALGAYFSPRISPVGKRVAFAANNKDILVYDWERDTTTRLTFADQNQLITHPVWTPDGKHIVFRSQSPAGTSFQWIRSDGAGAAQNLLENKIEARPYSFSPDGARLVYAAQGDSQAGLDLWTLPLDLSDPEHPKAGKPELFLTSLGDQYEPAFSPDGRWIAYRSTAGTSEIFVQPFPGPGGKWLIGPGRHPIWSHNSRELFYLSQIDNRIMAVSYSAGKDSFVPAGKSRVWSETPIMDPNQVFSPLDLAPDGKRFVVPPRPGATGGQKSSAHVTVLLNFFDELRRKPPADK